MCPTVVRPYSRNPIRILLRLLVPLFVRGNIQPPRGRSNISEIDRVYTIVVHGTRAGRSKGDWWKRNSIQDNPFCQTLSEDLDAAGVPFKVWQNCYDFPAMQEFEWSGDNKHEARLEAGKQLGTYLNEAQEHVIKATGRRPWFNLIGHSHGGNVILASLGHLREPIDILGIHLLGTPFMLYQGAWSTHGRNIYLSSDLYCGLIRVYVARKRDSPTASDEIQQLFNYLENRRYFRREIRSLLLGVVRRPKWERVRRTPAYSRELVLLADGDYVEPFPYYAGVWTKDPPLRRVVRNYVKQVGAFVAGPFKRLFVAIAAAILAPWAARTLFEVATGLNATLFDPKRIVVGRGQGFSLGFSTDATIWSHDLAIDEAPTFEMTIGEWLGDLLPEDSGVIRERLHKIKTQIEFFHSAYYSSDEVVQQIVMDTYNEMIKCNPGLVNQSKFAEWLPNRAPRGPGKAH